MFLGNVQIKSNNLGLRDESTSINYSCGEISSQGRTERFLGIVQIASTSNQTVQKDVGNTIARGILGGILLGPIGAVGGLLLGRNKVEGTNEYVFKVLLADGKFFIFSTTSSETVANFHSIQPFTETSSNNALDKPSSTARLDKSKRLPKSIIDSYKIKPDSAEFSNFMRADILKKIKKYEVREVNRQLVDHMYDLAGYLIDGRYCEKNTAKGRQILLEAIELAKQVVKKDQQKFIDKCRLKITVYCER